MLLAGGGTFIDAPAALAAWLQLRQQLGMPELGPLFCWPDVSAFTVADVCSAVRACMSAVGLQPRFFGAHSLRIGGATAALAAGVSPQEIRLMGRWSSEIYEIYCRMSEQSALRVGAAIGSAVVHPEARAFREERLELQPDEVAEIGRVFEDLSGDEMRDMFGDMWEEEFDM